MTSPASRIADNLARIRQRIASAAVRSGRTSDDITLVAVTKYAGLPEIAALIAAGCHDLGESRPQELWDRAAACSLSPVRWHLVGHLQRNKVRRTLPLVTLIHSLDSVRLAEALNAESAAVGRPARVLVEVNVSGDAAKHGFAPQELESAAAQLAAFEHLRIEGLMAMASRQRDPQRARREFKTLGELRGRLRGLGLPSLSLDQLSMGMSGDFEIAIEEGATIVRIGSALFEGIDS